jgi:hypothetical protein
MAGSTADCRIFKTAKRSMSAAAQGQQLGRPLCGSDVGLIFLNQRFDQYAQPQDWSAGNVREFDLPSGIATQIPADIAAQVSKDLQYPLARGLAILKDCCYRSVRKFAFGYMK